jgi:hypothetical protein
MGEDHWTQDGFELQIKDGQLIITTAVFDAPGVAKECLEEILTRWRKSLDLKDLRVSFSIIREPSPDVPGAFRVTQRFQTIRSIIPATANMPTPPPPSEMFKEGPHTAWVARYVHELQDGSPVCGPADGIRSIIRGTGDSESIKARYNICDSVLSEIGKLSTYQDPAEGRKFQDTPEKQRPLTKKEVIRLRTAGILCGKRYLEIEYGQPCGKQIDKGCLPPLEHSSGSGGP